MGRRNRDHILKIAYWQENELIQEEYAVTNFADALNLASSFPKAAINIYDINNILVYFSNLEIIDLIPETVQESIEEIIEELKQEEIALINEEVVIDLTIDELFSEPKIDAFKKPDPKQPVKKTVTKVDTKKVEAKKAAIKKTTAKKNVE